MKGGLLLDVVVSKSATILKLLASKDEALLVRGDALLVLDLCLHVVDGVRGLHLQCDGLARQGLDEDLHTTTKAEHQVKGGLLLDVVVSKCTAILELLAGKDEALLVQGDVLLVLDLRLHIVDGVRRLNLKGDGLAGEGLHKDLGEEDERALASIGRRFFGGDWVGFADRIGEGGGDFIIEEAGSDGKGRGVP